MIRTTFIASLGLLCGLATPARCATNTVEPPPAAPPPRFELQTDGVWHLNAPGRPQFDASALLLRPDGELWTLSNLGSTLFRIRLRADTNEADLIVVPGIFTDAQLRPFGAGMYGRYDRESLAQDEQGRIYTTEEANRWVLLFDPASNTVERLNIDWAPVQKYFHPTDRNASLEGVAVGGGRLYVANERQQGRIIVVDPANWRVVDDFVVRPAGSEAADTQYSDLCWFDGSLWALLRANRCVLQIEPKTHRVLAEYHYAKAEAGSDFDYPSLFGVMEGLAVDREHLWLVTDNNGQARRGHPGDNRPSLVRFLRPKVP